ncbi:hypothetical protein BV22DRAFT_1134128 [Leucogyrophana mollusca]|uniref:Uncharacterized protein n=1 Tax=Leucogyrophana mollusca TaxID=85980 RepID=A0ACB8B0L5_9AGAM|nr:hypothetical protein BV22DRAFT_1134128 [Leucogyrophana mollusca]
MSSSAESQEVLYYSAYLRAEQIFVASFTLLFYDHFITLHQEIEYFWSGPWNISRVLYFGIRYLPEVQVILIMLVNHGNIGYDAYVKLTEIGRSRFSNGALLYSCGRVAQVVLALSTVSIALNQAALTLRVCYLFTHRKVIQIGVVAVFLVCTAALIFLVASVSGVPGTAEEEHHLRVAVCKYASGENTFWRMYLPPVILHATLYLLTSYRLATAGGSTKNIESIARRFIGDFANTIITVAVSHAMLSLRTLAARLNVDPGWLLSHSELSRVHFKRGAHEGELFVEIQAGERDGLGIELSLRQETAAMEG